VLYRGPDLPAADWVATAADAGARVAVIGSPTRADAKPAADVARALRANDPGCAIAFGGQAADRAATQLARAELPGAGPAVTLPPSLVDAVDMVGSLISRGSAA
jgi:hypothetical protein